MIQLEHRVVGDLHHADRVMKSAFAIGNHQAIDSEARSYVVETLREFLELEELN